MRMEMKKKKFYYGHHKGGIDRLLFDWWDGEEVKKNKTSWFFSLGDCKNDGTMKREGTANWMKWFNDKNYDFPSWYKLEMTIKNQNMKYSEQQEMYESYEQLATSSNYQW